MCAYEIGPLPPPTSARSDDKVTARHLSDVTCSLHKPSGLFHTPQYGVHSHGCSSIRTHATGCGESASSVVAPQRTWAVSLLSGNFIGTGRRQDTSLKCLACPDMSMFLLGCCLLPSCLPPFWWLTVALCNLPRNGPGYSSRQVQASS